MLFLASHTVRIGTIAQMYEALSGAAAANILAAGGSVKRAAAAAAAAVKAAGGTEEDALFAAKSIGDSIAEHKARAASVQKIAAKTTPV